MKVKLLQSARFGEKDYGLGIHEMPDSLKKDPTFHRYLKAGLIHGVDSKLEVSQETLQEKQQKINEKLIAESDAAIKKVADERKAQEEKVDEEEDDDFFDDDKPSKKKATPKKQKR